jgi:hypothetical protein
MAGSALTVRITVRTQLLSRLTALSALRELRPLDFIVKASLAHHCGWLWVNVDAASVSPLVFVGGGGSNVLGRLSSDDLVGVVDVCRIGIDVAGERRLSCGSELRVGA